MQALAPAGVPATGGMQACRVPKLTPGSLAHARAAAHLGPAGGRCMLILILGLVIFFAIHSVRMVAGGFREAQVTANERRWKGIYSLISLVGFALIIWGWILFRAEAPDVYLPPDWGRHVNWAFALVAFILFAVSGMPAG